MRFSELTGRRVGVWGAGREGLAAHRALRTQDPEREVLIYTDQPVLPEEREAFGGGARFEHGADGFGELESCDVVIRSPGVSRYRPEVERLDAAGVELTTGTNLWFAEHGDERVVAVTGTKGKSTTSSLIAHLLNESDDSGFALHAAARAAVGIARLDAARYIDSPRMQSPDRGGDVVFGEPAGKNESSRHGIGQRLRKPRPVECRAGAAGQPARLECIEQQAERSRITRRVL